MTWGQIRIQLKKRFAGIDLEVLTAVLQEVYEDLLDDIPQQAGSANGTLILPAVESAGTVAIANGSPDVIGTGTAFSADLLDRWFRVPARKERYVVNQVTDATHLTLDRIYEGEDAAASAFEIYADTFQLPDWAQTVVAVREPQLGIDVVRKSEVELASIMNQVAFYHSTPVYWSPAGASPEEIVPQLSQIRLFPVPLAGGSVEYTYDVAMFEVDALAMTATPAPFISTSAILSGASRICYEISGNPLGIAAASKRFDEAKARMRAKDSRRRGSTPLKLKPAAVSVDRRRLM